MLGGILAYVLSFGAGLCWLEAVSADNVATRVSSPISPSDNVLSSKR
jgi:hypothetical protein